jgi:hypothetical protein
MILGAALFVLSACSRTPTVCTSELGIRISPSSAAIAVGEVIQPAVRLSTCGGQAVLTDVFSFVPEDSSVVAVDESKDELHGVAPGRTFVEVRGTQYGPVGSLTVDVVARRS